MAKDIDEKIGAMSQQNWHGLKYKNYRVHEMPTKCPRNCPALLTDNLPSYGKCGGEDCCIVGLGGV